MTQPDRPLTRPTTSGGDGEGVVRGRVRFRSDGRLTIVQFNDTQDDHRTDRRTVELEEAVLDDAQPGFVVINGDVVDGTQTSELEVRQAFNNVVLPMERRGIPWAVTLGNHDAESQPRTGLGGADFLDLLARYPHNVNTRGADVHGAGNEVVTVASSTGAEDAFAIWLLDSGAYAPDIWGGQRLGGYDWVRPDQVAWYRRTSQALEAQRGRLVPGLAFQHIALWEHRIMWFAGPDSRTDADHERAVALHSIIGERNEDECPGPINSGLFSALLERGDVRGLYVGHDHANSYEGDYYGVRLGFSPATGFGPYGLDGERRNHLRGARVFHLDENTADVFTGSELRLAQDYGIDVSPEPQPGEPAPLPDYMV